MLRFDRNQPAAVFCDIHGLIVTLEDDDAFDLVMDAAREGPDVEDIAARLRA